MRKSLRLVPALALMVYSMGGPQYRPYASLTEMLHRTSALVVND
jgi:hypothetical protein